jgi:hypothetical protein
MKEHQHPEDPTIMEKAMNRIAGDTHHLKELQKLEALLYTAFDLQGFFDELIKFLEKRFGKLEGYDVSIEDLKDIDTFVKKRTLGKIDTVEQYIVRAYVIGKIVESRESAPVLRKELVKIDTLPATVKEAVKTYSLTPREGQMLKQAMSHTAQHLTSASNTTINRVQSVTFNNLIKREGYKALENQLRFEFFDDSQEINRNWNRVAISEINYAFNNAYLALMKGGEFVVGISMPDRCPHCGALIDGKVYPFIQTTNESMNYSGMEAGTDKYNRLAWGWENLVWEGKDNYGRSGSPKKRDGSGREHHEKYMPAIPKHPYCRCRWIRINPNMQYVHGGEVKMRVMDEKQWKAWHESKIEPIIKQMQEYKYL